MEESADARPRSRSGSNTPLPCTNRDRSTPIRQPDVETVVEGQETAEFTSPPAHRTRNALKHKSNVLDKDASDYLTGETVLSPIARDLSEEAAENIKNYTYEYQQTTTSRTISSPNNGGRAFGSYVDSGRLSASGRNYSGRSRTCSEKSSESFIDSILADSERAAEEGTDHLPYRIYKRAVEYWNKYPKTDYTYSHLSRDRVELAPGQIAVPNMSRLSLGQYRLGASVYSGGLDEEESAALLSRTEEIRKRWTSDSKSYLYGNNYNRYENLSNTAYDETDLRTGTFSKAPNRHWWITRLLIAIYTSVVTTTTTVKNKIFSRDSAQSYPYYYSSSNRYMSQTSKFASLKEHVNRRKWWLLLLLLLLLPFLYYLLYGLPILPIIFEKSDVRIFEKSVPFQLTDEMINKIVLQVQQRLPAAETKVIERIIESTSSDFDPSVLAQQQGLIDRLYAEIDLLKEKVAANENLDSNIDALISKHNNHLLVNIFGIESSDNTVTPEDVKSWLGKQTVNNEKLDEKLADTMNVVSNLELKLANKMKIDSDKLKDDLSDIVKMNVEEAKNSALLAGVPVNVPANPEGCCNCEDVAQKIVGMALSKYNADKTGRVDYALESAGGQVISTRCTEQYQQRTAVLTIFGIPFWYPSNSPRVLLQPGTSPGECWAFQGFPGYIVIKLHTRIHVTGFTLEHTPVELSPTGRIDSAPKNFTVMGLQDEVDTEPFIFGNYEYTHSGQPLQYFDIQNSPQPDPEKLPGHEIVELRIDTNHGHPQHTCIYRFRVHGIPVGDISSDNIPER